MNYNGSKGCTRQLLLQSVVAWSHVTVTNSGPTMSYRNPSEGVIDAQQMHIGYFERKVENRQSLSSVSRS